MRSLVVGIAAFAALAVPSPGFAGGQSSGVVAKIDRSAGLVAVVQSWGAVALVHVPAGALHSSTAEVTVEFGRAGQINASAVQAEGELQQSAQQDTQDGTFDSGSPGDASAGQ